MGLADIFLQQDHLTPYDVTLVAKDGKEFKAHRKVLLNASPFFEKLLNSGMKETKERVILLEIITDTQMTDILKFIYTGKVEIPSEEHAQDLIAVADYLCLSKLRRKVENFLEQNMSILNCVSNYYLAERYLCHELISSAQNFISSNFSTVAETEGFLSLPSHEVEKWISGNDVVISAEGDVFKIILRWIDYDKRKRSIKFSDLFRHVRLTFISRETLKSDVMTNHLVKENKVCLNAVTDALAWIDQATSCNVPRPHSPRKALETCVVAICSNKAPQHTFIYHPERGEFYRLPERSLAQFLPEHVILCRGRLFVFPKDISKTQCYDPDFNRWSPAPWAEMDSNQILISDKQQALKAVLVVRNKMFFITEKYANSTWLWKYDFDLNSTATLSHWLDKIQACFVVVDKYIYAIGGCQDDLSSDEDWLKVFPQSSRFDTEETKWQNMASLQQARYHAFGVGSNEKIFVAGGCGECFNVLRSCEVYNVEADEWYFIASLTVPRCTVSMVLVDDTLCVLCPTSESNWEILFYDHRKDEWNVTTRIPFNESERTNVCMQASSLTLFKGTLDILEPIADK